MTSGICNDWDSGAGDSFEHHELNGLRSLKGILASLESLSLSGIGALGLGSDTDCRPSTVTVCSANLFGVN